MTSAFAKLNVTARRIGLPFLTSLILVLSWAGASSAEIISNTTYAVDLTSGDDASKKASWSAPDVIGVTPKGLGWGDGSEQGSRDFWLMTEPIAIGLSWRPASIAMVKAAVERPGTSGMLYARYSADGKHWTAWQYLEEAKPAAADISKQVFQGTVRVPYREQKHYHELRLEYARRDDVPWPGDEEALVKDILKRDSKFFHQATPFIGYVQFLYEAQLHGDQRLKAVKAEIGWALGGKHLPPKNENDRNGREGPWRFQVGSDKAALDERNVWSKPVNGLQARLSFEKKKISNGTPIVTTYLEFRNISSNGNVMEIPWDEADLQFTVTDEAGKKVPPADGPFDEMRAPSGMIRLPIGSSLRLNISHWGAGIPRDQAAHLDLGALTHWQFKKYDRAHYYLQATVLVKVTKNGYWFGALVIPKSRIPTTNGAAATIFLK